HTVLHHFFAGRDLTPERGDFDHHGTELDVRQAEAAADDPAVAEELLDLIRMRRRTDVEIFGMTAEEEVADAAADEVGDVIALPEPIEDFQRVRIDVTPRDRMLITRYHPRFDHRAALYASIAIWGVVSASSLSSRSRLRGRFRLRRLPTIRSRKRASSTINSNFRPPLTPRKRHG